MAVDADDARGRARARLGDDGRGLLEDFRRAARPREAHGAGLAGELVGVDLLLDGVGAALGQRLLRALVREGAADGEGRGAPRRDAGRRPRVQRFLADGLLGPRVAPSRHGAGRAAQLEWRLNLRQRAEEGCLSCCS